MDCRPAFVVAERGTSGQRRAHCHGLLGRHGKLQLEPWRKGLWEDWHRRYGRCQFLPLDDLGGARWYVAEYCAKMPDKWRISNNGRWT